MPIGFGLVGRTWACRHFARSQLRHVTKNALPMENGASVLDQILRIRTGGGLLEWACIIGDATRSLATRI